MQIDRHLILRLENLARLQLSEEERDLMLHDLNEILEMVEKLNELDTENVEPLIYLSNQSQQLRSDEVKGQVTTEEALKNAP
ncbi:MAG: Asp-tRNA(Asn)/Glu-tRNA(Gln) amidotransferase GatCAB subunit C, partial [Bacteroidetes bacterium]